jgi:hypothetical protein
MQRAVVVVAHLGVDPVQPVRQVQPVEQGEQGLVGLADEMVVALDPRAGEIEVRRHAADAVVAFQHVDRVAGLQQLERGHQAHRPGAEHAVGSRSRSHREAAGGKGEGSATTRTG